MANNTQTVRLMMMALFICFGFFNAEKAFATGESPQTFTLDGQLFQPASTTPLLDSNAKIMVQILNPAKTCILYEEEQTVNTTSTDGYFNIQVGSVVGNIKRTGSDPGRTMSQVFQNSQTIVATVVPGQTCPFSSYTPTSADKRYFRLIITPSATNVASTLSPDMVLDSVPNALVAQSVQGLEKDSILQVKNNGITALTQANLEAIFTTPAYSTLQTLISGNFVQTGSNGASLPAFGADPTSPPPGSIWYDSNTNEVKYQNNVGAQVLGVAGSGVSATGAFGSTPNSAGLTISGTTINMEPASATNPGGVSTGAQTLAGAKTFSAAASFTSAGTGVAVTNNATVGGTLGVTGNTTVGGTLGVTSTLSVGSSAIVGGAFQTNGNLYFNGVAATNPMLKRNTTALEVKLGDDSALAILRAADPSAATDVATKGYVDTATSGVSGKVAKSGDSMSGNLVLENQKQVRFSEDTGSGSNYAAIQAPATLAADYTLTLPVDDGTNGQVLSTNGSGILSWISAATGTVSTVGNFSGASTAKGLSISGSDVILHPADGSNPGAVTTGAQTLAGAKTFSSQVTASAAGTGLSVTNNATVGGTLGVTGNTTLGGTLGVTGNSTIGGTLGVTSNTTVGGSLGVTGAATFSSTGSFTDNVTMANQKEVRFSEATGGGSEYVGLRSPAALGASYVLTLPTDDGAADQVLKTDGTGNLSWVSAATGTVNAIGNFGSTPNTKGMTISSGDINLEPADATNPGAVSTAAQTFAGAKTFSGAASFTAAATGLAVTNNATIGGTLGVTSNTTVGGTLGVTGVTTHTANVIIENEKEIRFNEASGSGANYISLKAPTTLAGDFTLTLPVDDGTADQILKTDGTGNLSWVTPAVTSGISVTAPVTNSGTAAAPNIGISQATTSTNGYVSSADWNTFNNKQTATLADGKILVGNGSNVATAVSVTGDVAITNLGATTVNKIKGVTVSTAPTVTGQVLRFDGTNLVPNFISMVDLRSTVTGTTALAASCTAAQTLTYNTVGDNLTCSNIAIGDSAITYASQAANKFLASPSGGAGAPTYRTIAAADLPVTGAGGAIVNGGNSFGAASVIGNSDNFDLGLKTNNLTRMTILAGGNVGIGTSTPGQMLTVAGTIESTTGGIKFPDGTTQVTAGPKGTLIVVDQKAANTPGGTCTSGSWITRTLNTVSHNSITGASLASNQVTLPAGTYIVRGSAPAYDLDRHQAKLYNVTDAADAVIGSGEFVSNATPVAASRSEIVGAFTIAAAKVFEVRHRCQTTGNNQSFGLEMNWGNVEVYTQIEIVQQ